jgi:hypothetical protein
VAGDVVRFDWDHANAEHIARHSVKPDEAEQAIRNDPLDMHYEVVEGEERWTAVGHSAMHYGSSPRGLLAGGREKLICAPRGC